MGSRKDFVAKYGPWALIAGGAQGIGEAYTRYAAAQGLNVIVLDLSDSALDRIASVVKDEYGVDCLPIKVDLADDGLLERVTAEVADREVGLLIYNAAIADVGPFYKQHTGLGYEKRRIAVNVTAPMVLTYHFAQSMLARGCGGVVLMSSGAGLQGAPYYAHYSATKAYSINLAEALWYEFAPYGVDVLAVVAGMTLSTASKGFEHIEDRSLFQTTDELVAEAMDALGQQGMLIAGEHNRQRHEMGRQVPRETMIRYMADHAVNHFMGGEPPKQNI